MSIKNNINAEKKQITFTVSFIPLECYEEASKIQYTNYLDRVVKTTRSL